MGTHRLVDADHIFILFILGIFIYIFGNIDTFPVRSPGEVSGILIRNNQLIRQMSPLRQNKDRVKEIC